MTLEQGGRYYAPIRLGLFEQVASNDTIRGKLEEAGFCAVAVGGGGRDRFAEGTWGRPTQDVELPDQIVVNGVRKIG